MDLTLIHTLLTIIAGATIITGLMIVILLSALILHIKQIKILFVTLLEELYFEDDDE